MSQVSLSSPTPPIKAKSSGKDILVSGTVHTFAPDNLDLFLADLQISLEFKNDSGEARMETEPGSGKAVRFRLFNFNNSIGTGTTQPIEIGHFQNRNLYLAFTVYAFDQQSLKIVHYTFFLGEARNV